MHVFSYGIELQKKGIRYTNTCSSIKEYNNIYIFHFDKINETQLITNFRTICIYLLSIDLI